MYTTKATVNTIKPWPHSSRRKRDIILGILIYVQKLQCCSTRVREARVQGLSSWSSSTKWVLNTPVDVRKFYVTVYCTNFDHTLTIPVYIAYVYWRSLEKYRRMYTSRVFWFYLFFLVGSLPAHIVHCTSTCT